MFYLAFCGALSLSTLYTELLQLLTPFKLLSVLLDLLLNDLRIIIWAQRTSALVSLAFFLAHALEAILFDFHLLLQSFICISEIFCKVE